MNYRDFLQKVIYVIINPIIKAMIRLHITPNIVTFIGDGEDSSSLLQDSST